MLPPLFHKRGGHGQSGDAMKGNPKQEPVGMGRISQAGQAAGSKGLLASQESYVILFDIVIAVNGKVMH